MKKSIASLALLSIIALASTSCRETKDEPDTVIEKEVTIEDQEPDQVIVEEDEGLLEQAAEEVDKEINEEVSEEIDKIGDDQ